MGLSPSLLHHFSRAELWEYQAVEIATSGRLGLLTLKGGGKSRGLFQAALDGERSAAGRPKPRDSGRTKTLAAGAPEVGPHPSQALTFLTTMEIQSIHEAFLKLTHGAIEGEEQFLTSEQVSNIPALRVNPFRDQICKVFSTHEDGLFSFEDFLEMFSVFSETASLSLKISYAFQIFDLNDNNYIDQADIKNIVLRLTNGLMDDENIVTLTHNILNEGDLNSDGMLSFSEFESVINRLPDFQKSFTIRFRQ